MRSQSRYQRGIDLLGVLDPVGFASPGNAIVSIQSSGPSQRPSGEPRSRSGIRTLAWLSCRTARSFGASKVFLQPMARDQLLPIRLQPLRSTRRGRTFKEASFKTSTSLTSRSRMIGSQPTVRTRASTAQNGSRLPPRSGEHRVTTESRSPTVRCWGNWSSTQPREFAGYVDNQDPPWRGTERFVHPEPTQHHH